MRVKKLNITLQNKYVKWIKYIPFYGFFMIKYSNNVPSYFHI